MVHMMKQDRYAYLSDRKHTASKRENLCEYDQDLGDVTNMDEQNFHVSQWTLSIVLQQYLG